MIAAFAQVQFVWWLSIVIGQLPPAPKATGTAEAAPQLVVTQRKIALGTVLEGDKVKLDWLLENRGNADLVIDRVKPACGCTAVDLTDEEKTIAPGGSLRLRSQFDSTGRRGRQDKTVTVYTNDPLVPAMKLEFTADVEALYETKPSTVLNLRAVQRGELSSMVLEITPGKGRKVIAVTDVEYDDNLPLTWEKESFEAKSGTGQRIRFRVDPYAALGTLTSKAKIKLEVDGIPRERLMSLRAEIVGELSTMPKVPDATRHEARPGKKLPKVTIRAMNKRPFEVLGVSAGPLLDVEITPSGKPKPKSAYTIRLSVRKDAPPGPFGTMLEIRTDSLDQPLVQVPVFGMVAPLVKIEPAVILLRQDGTLMGANRRLRVQASTQQALDISSIHCENDSIVATIDEEASRRYKHLRFLKVELVGKMPPGTHNTTLILTTGVPGAETLIVPVIVEVPN